MTGKCVLDFKWNCTQIERVTGGGIERANAALARITFELPSLRMYSALIIKS